MKYELSKRIYADCSVRQLLSELRTQFRVTSQDVQLDHGCVEVTKAGKCFGVSLRKDTTIVSIKPRRRGGNVLVANCACRPSWWFWTLAILGAPAGTLIVMYLYAVQQTRYREGVQDVLNRVADDFEER